MTFPRILYWLGMACCIVLIVACFMPWAYYNDPSITNEAQRTFTGFYSYTNYYGKPGKFLSIFAGLSLLLKLLPQVWAKQVDLFLCGFTLAYGVKSFFAYKGVYGAGVIPQLQPGLFIMLAAALVMMAAAAFPVKRVKVVKQ